MLRLVVAGLFVLLVSVTTAEAKRRHTGDDESAGTHRHRHHVRHYHKNDDSDRPRKHRRIAHVKHYHPRHYRAVIVPPPTIFQPPTIVLVPLPDTEDEYLCDAYKRMPNKVDSAGDFTWKDPAAASKRGLDTCRYVIGGMHPKFRHALAQLGHKADAAGIHWGIMSGFRDDYRQHIAAGYKASDCGSWHGGSCRTKGFGDGRAADIWTVGPDGRPGGPVEALWSLADKISASLGLSRPMPGIDPAHVQLAASGDTATAGHVTVKHYKHVASIRRHRRHRDDDDD